MFDIVFKVNSMIITQEFHLILRDQLNRIRNHVWRTLFCFLLLYNIEIYYLIRQKPTAYNTIDTKLTWYLTN